MQQNYFKIISKYTPKRINLQSFFFLEKKIYFHMRKTQQIKLCTKGRVKKRQQKNTKKNQNEIKERDSQNVFQCINQDIIY